MDIAVSFAVITSGNDQAALAAIVESIERQQIPEYEILIVGGATCDMERPKVRHIAFDESIKPAGWITRKKNLATENSRYNVIVYFHDYHIFQPGWYRALCEFGIDWDICMHRVECIDGTRFFGWQMYDHPTVPRYFNVPYHRHDLLRYMYFSGGYWVAKKSAMQQAPLDESLVWGQGEDVEWSMRVRDRFVIKANPACVVRHNKVHAGMSFCRKMAAVEPDFDAYLAAYQPADPSV